jgi:succinyl-CoA synthetase alpha subunit
LNNEYVIKAQVLTGHRGQNGGIKIAKNIDEIKKISKDMLSKNINGFEVDSLLILEKADIFHEFYISFTYARDKQKYLIIFSENGGVDIESQISSTDEIQKIYFSPLELPPHIKLSQSLSQYETEFNHLVQKLFKAFIENDCTLVEINPLAILKDESFCAIDAKLTLDDAALGRISNLNLTVQHSTNYVQLNGNVGVLCNGAGLTMAVVDLITVEGEKYNISPANFLDIGGGATADNVLKCLELIDNKNTNIKCFYINICAGITSCVDVVNGILNFIKNTHDTRPFFLYLIGTELEKALDILNHSNCKNIFLCSSIEKCYNLLTEYLTTNVITSPKYIEKIFTEKGLNKLIEDKRFIVQGITGKFGMIHTERMLKCGTNIIGGTSPNKGGTTLNFDVENKTVSVPVYTKISEVPGKIDASVIFVPPFHAKNAVLEAIDNDIKLIIVITEHIPLHDEINFVCLANKKNIKIVGPNCPGILEYFKDSNNSLNLGIIPNDISHYGKLGLISRSGTLSYVIMSLLERIGIKKSYGLGGDMIRGTSFIDVLKEFENDSEIETIFLIGENGGTDEIEAAEYAKKYITKKVLFYICGISTPIGKTMGHAGAITNSKNESTVYKINEISKLGFTCFTTLMEIEKMKGDI